MMMIYAPSPDAEFAPVFGGLTAEQTGLFDEALGAIVPPVRYRKELDEGIHPAVKRFTLKLHRDDRERALPVIHELMNRITQHGPRLSNEDRELAALLRQLARAREADDQSAAGLMMGYLCQNLQYLLERLLLGAKVKWAVDLWLDGISALDVQYFPPYGVVIRGYIYAGKGSDGSQWREPFEAELCSSTRTSALERFVARFGAL